MLLVTAAGPGIISGSPGPPEFLWRLLLPKPASDADLSLGARTGGGPPRAGAWRNLRARKPLMVECVEMLFGALRCGCCACRTDANCLPHAPIAPASGHRGVSKPTTVRYRSPGNGVAKTTSPGQGAWESRWPGWFGLVDRDSYVGGAAQCAGSTCDHHAGRTRVGL